MPLFICDCCGCVDNTALGGSFHLNRCSAKGYNMNIDLCCKCHTGKWHNHFKYELCTSEVFFQIGESNFIYWMYENRPQPTNLLYINKELYVPKDRSNKSKRQLKLLKRGYKKRK